jgi:hypothetical protein
MKKKIKQLKNAAHVSFSHFSLGILMVNRLQASQTRVEELELAEQVCDLVVCPHRPNSQAPS